MLLVRVEGAHLPARGKGGGAEDERRVRSEGILVLLVHRVRLHLLGVRVRVRVRVGVGVRVRVVALLAHGARVCTSRYSMFMCMSMWGVRS